MSEKPKRRWYQFSLGTMLVVFTLLCGPGGWILYQRQRVKQGKQTKAALELLGGQFGYDTDLPSRPSWLRPLLGDNHFSDAVSFTFPNEVPRGQMTFLEDSRHYIDSARLQPFPSEPMPGIRHFHQLRTVDLEWTGADDRACRHLATLSRLVELNLSGTRVTDAAPVSLKKLPKLETLRLRKTLVTDAGVANLSGLHELQTLQLSHTKVSDAGIEHLRDLINVRQLDLSHAEITDEGLASLEKLSKLKALNLDGTLVQGPGLIHLERLASLTSLNLQRTQVGGAELKRLAGMKNLKELYLYGSAFTLDDRKKLRESLPDCVIYN